MVKKMKLIDANRLKKLLMEYAEICDCTWLYLDEVMDVIDKQEVIEDVDENRSEH